MNDFWMGTKEGLTQLGEWVYINSRKHPVATGIMERVLAKEAPIPVALEELELKQKPSEEDYFLLGLTSIAIAVTVVTIGLSALLSALENSQQG